MSAFVWDVHVGRYRDTKTGRYVAEATVREGVENVVAQASSNMRDLARRYRDTNMSLADFQKAMMREVKLAHTSAAMAAAGGRSQMTQSLWGRVGQIVREQYSYLQNFMTATLNGMQKLNGRFDARAMSYASAARATFENVRRVERAAAGYQFERNILHAKESCAQCRDLAAREWVPLGTLPPVGARTCRSNCRCTLAYRERFSVEIPDVAPLRAAS